MAILEKVVPLQVTKMNITPEHRRRTLHDGMAVGGQDRVLRQPDHITDRHSHMSIRDCNDLALLCSELIGGIVRPVFA